MRRRMGAEIGAEEEGGRRKAKLVGRRVLRLVQGREAAADMESRGRRSAREGRGVRLEGSW